MANYSNINLSCGFRGLRFCGRFKTLNVGSKAESLDGAHRGSLCKLLPYHTAANWQGPELRAEQQYVWLQLHLCQLIRHVCAREAAG